MHIHHYTVVPSIGTTSYDRTTANLEKKLRKHQRRAPNIEEQAALGAYENLSLC